MSLANRFPKSQEIVSVYAVGVVVLYAWMFIFTMKDFVNTWSLFLNVADVLSLFAYTTTGAFVESLLVIAVLLFIHFLLPQKITANRFVPYGVILTLSFLGAIMRYYPAIFFVIAFLALALLSEYVQAVRKIIETIADRCIIFLYVYMPLSLVSIIVVVVRNIGA